MDIGTRPSTHTHTSVTAHTSTKTTKTTLTMMEKCMFGLVAVMALTACQAFAPPHHGPRQHHAFTTLSMVRNIDLPEAVVFYGWESLLDEPSSLSQNDNNDNTSSSSSASLKAGVESLLKECTEIGTAVLLIVPPEDFDVSVLERRGEAMPSSEACQQIHLVLSQYPAPNPRSLHESLLSTLVQPRGFGGSSGFGRKKPDPERPPEPKHTVVLASSADECLAAKYVGTRVICLDNDNEFADAVVDSWEELGSLDDIATPGSFWLNPPHPNDGYGNRIDLDEIMAQYEQESTEPTVSVSSSTRKPFMSIGSDGNIQGGVGDDDDEEDDDEVTMDSEETAEETAKIDSILADIDALVDESGGNEEEEGGEGSPVAEQDMGDDEMASILADLDSL